MKLSVQEIQVIIHDMFKVAIDICIKNNITYYCQAGTVLGTVRHGGTIPWDIDADIIIPNNQIDYFAECAAKYLPEKYYVDYFKIDAKSLRQFPRIGMKGYSTDFLHLDIFRLIGLPNTREEQLALVKEAQSYTKLNAAVRHPLYKYIGKLQLRSAVKYGVQKIKDREKYIILFDELCNRYPYDTSEYVMNPSGKYGEKNIFHKEVYGEGELKKYEDIFVVIPQQYDFYLKQYYGDYTKIPEQKYIDSVMNKKYKVR